jgi:hypothetical protein
MTSQSSSLIKANPAEKLKPQPVLPTKSRNSNRPLRHPSFVIRHFSGVAVSCHITSWRDGPRMKHIPDAHPLGSVRKQNKL